MLLNSPVVLHQLQQRGCIQHRGQPQDPSPTSNKKNKDQTTLSVTLLLHRPSSRQYLSPSTSSNGESLSNHDQQLPFLFIIARSNRDRKTER
ncbi:hypothetical protein NC651_008507 [Populus alba x Populus x berolinensis]|nr:hypothetical protein NC651_008507 [Populus alba x Populus x berolinensis]